MCPLAAQCPGRRAVRLQGVCNTPLHGVTEYTDVVLFGIEGGAYARVAFDFDGGAGGAGWEVIAAFLSVAVFFLVAINLCFGDGIGSTVTSADGANEHRCTIGLDRADFAITCGGHRCRRTSCPSQSKNTQSIQSESFHQKVSLLVGFHRYPPLVCGSSVVCVVPVVGMEGKHR